MQPYQHFTLEERESLWFKRQERKSIRQIAREMKRNPSSISRELKRNGKKDGSYNAWWGCSLYIWRRKKCGRKSRIGQDEKLRQFICEGLNRFWSPEIIAAKWNETNPGEKITYSSIYNALKKDLIEGVLWKAFAYFCTFTKVSARPGMRGKPCASRIHAGNP